MLQVPKTTELQNEIVEQNEGSKVLYLFLFSIWSLCPLGVSEGIK